MSSKTQFAKVIFDALKSNDKSNYTIESAQIPGMETYKKAGTSSNVGRAVGAIVGVGWNSSTNAVILLANSPIREITIKEDRFFAYVNCTFPLVRPIGVKKRSWLDDPAYHYGYVKLIKSGFLRKEAERLQIIGNEKKDFLAIENIENDRALLDELFQLGQFPLVAENKDSNGAFISFYVGEPKEDKSYAGWIDVILNRTAEWNIVQVTTLLHSLFGIAQHFQNAYSVPPPPPPP